MSKDLTGQVVSNRSSLCDIGLVVVGLDYSFIGSDDDNPHRLTQVKYTEIIIVKYDVI